MTLCKKCLFPDTKPKMLILPYYSAYSDEYKTIHNRIWYRIHKKIIRKKQAVYREQHKEEHINYNKEMYKKLRKEVFSYYGEKCACCGESEMEFLGIDHINGGGTKHKKKVGHGIQLFRWIIKNNFPNNLQILCHNCNIAKSDKREFICPHKRKTWISYEAMC